MGRTRVRVHDRPTGAGSGRRCADTAFGAPASTIDFGGAILRWPDDKAEDRGLTVWHLAEKDSEWFGPSESTFMINYRVDDLGAMLEQLRAGGVKVIQGPESHENGKFAWIMDPDGNKVELWEPMVWDDKNKGA